jgi:hypothetical protein
LLAFIRDSFPASGLATPDLNCTLDEGKIEPSAKGDPPGGSFESRRISYRSNNLRATKEDNSWTITFSIEVFDG